MDNVEKSKQRLIIDENMRILARISSDTLCDMLTLKRAFEAVENGDLDINSDTTPATTMLADGVRRIFEKAEKYKEILDKEAYNG